MRFEGNKAADFEPSKERWCKTMDRPASACGCPDCGSSLIQCPLTVPWVGKPWPKYEDTDGSIRDVEPEDLIGTNIPLSWADSEDDKPESRADLRRVLTEWNDVTGALPRDSGWMCEVLGMMEDAYDLGAHQAAKELTK